MLPLETMATIGPSPDLPDNAAASASAPAPSEMIRTFSAMSRIASFVSLGLTTMEPSTTRCIRSHMRRKTLWPPAPSTNDGCHPVNACADPILNESAVGAAVSGSAPKTLMFGLSAFAALPTPTTSPPPPMPPMIAAVCGPRCQRKAAKNTGGLSGEGQAVLCVQAAKKPPFSLTQNQPPKTGDPQVKIAACRGGFVCVPTSS